MDLAAGSRLDNSCLLATIANKTQTVWSAFPTPCDRVDLGSAAERGVNRITDVGHDASQGGSRAADRRIAIRTFDSLLRMDSTQPGECVMLVLSRKTGERVIISGGITVQVVSIHGNQVRLGIAAPDDVCIRREELCFTIANASRSSSGFCDTAAVQQDSAPATLAATVPAELRRKSNIRRAPLGNRRFVQLASID